MKTQYIGWHNMKAVVDPRMRKKNLPCTVILRGSQEAQQKPWEFVVIPNCTCQSWSAHCDLDGTFLRGRWIHSNVCPAILRRALLRMESSSHAIRKGALLSSITCKGARPGAEGLTPLPAEDTAQAGGTFPIWVHDESPGPVLSTLFTPSDYGLEAVSWGTFKSILSPSRIGLLFLRP